MFFFFVKKATILLCAFVAAYNLCVTVMYGYGTCRVKCSY